MRNAEVEGGILNSEVGMRKAESRAHRAEGIGRNAEVGMRNGEVEGESRKLE